MEVVMLSGFWLGISAILIVAYFIDQHPSAPNFWRSLFRWGKMRIGFVSGFNYFYEVPKRWFQHFYILGIIANSTLLALLFCKLFLEKPFPVMLNAVMEVVQYPGTSTGNRNAVPVLLVLGMELVQVSRRSYETFFVNVFSAKATMTLLHYILGNIFYLSIGLSVLSGTDFQHLQLPSTISLLDIAVYGVAMVTFLAASLLQHQSFRILASLRTTRKGTKDTGYVLPTGGLFDLVSCPHFLAEILVYLSFCMMFSFHNIVLLSLFVFVLVNQVLAALLNHQWYCRNFPTACQRRRAIFPYLL